MDISPDYRDLFRILNKHKVKYLVIGAYAVVYYSEPRFTKDLDIWVKPDTGNTNKLYKSLKEFGAPLKGVKPDDFMNTNMVYQIGVPPVRIDIMIGLPQLNFGRAWKKRIKTQYDRVSINIIGIDELMKAKKQAKRKQDLLDLEALNKSLHIKSPR